MWDYLARRRRFQYLHSVMDSLDQKYLFGEITDEPLSQMEQVFWGLMKSALKTMTDEVAASRRLNQEYRDFIEQWIHEMKIPITGMQLIAQSVERVLFYARLGSVEKDYLVTEVSLKACALEVLAQSKQFLIQNNACIHTEGLVDMVYSDQKWLQFMLNQILMNSVKYRSGRPLVIDLASRDQGEYVTLSVTDNGMGVKESELGRVFDKGFVGSNGRKKRNRHRSVPVRPALHQDGNQHRDAVKSRGIYHRSIPFSQEQCLENFGFLQIC
ncbi:MAG: HAMP domain-containing histidine kinase [Lachnospiraceae bacterium]|nr:HAMP domain-containing histidine kinase [Lachnospiraceae bacterium]